MDHTDYWNVLKREYRGREWDDSVCHLHWLTTPRGQRLKYDLNCAKLRPLKNADELWVLWAYPQGYVDRMHLNSSLKTTVI